MLSKYFRARRQSMKAHVFLSKKLRSPSFQIVAAFFVYLLVDYLFFCYRRDFSLFTSLFCPSGDPLSFVWFLNWWPFALSHGINPFTSSYVWAPAGFNLIWATSVPSLSLLGYPITYLVGAMATYNVLSLLSLPLSALTAYALARYLTGDFWASLLAGYVFGFSSYQLGHFFGHLNLDFVFLVPLAIFIVIKRHRGEMSRKQFVICFAAIIVIECGISTEILATSTFFGFLSLLSFLLAYKDRRKFFNGIIKDMIASYALSAIILSPFLYHIIVGLKSVPKVINDPSLFSADVMNYMIPMFFTRFGGDVFREMTVRFNPSLAESGAYLGIVLILITIFSGLERTGERWGKALLFITAFTVISSLGPHLRINGVDTKIPLVWDLFVRLPLLKHALPVRFTMYVALAVCIWLACWLSNGTLSAKQKLMRYALAFIGIVMMIPSPKAYSWGQVDTPAFFEKQNIAKHLNPGDTVVVLPYGYLGNSMFWQYKSGMYFRIAGGYVGYTPDSFAKWPIVQAFYSTNENQPYDVSYFSNELAGFCASHNIKAIIAEPGVNTAILKSLRALNWEEHINADGVEIFKGILPAKEAEPVTIDQFVDNPLDNYGYFGQAETIDNFIITGGWAKTSFAGFQAKEVVITDENRKILAKTKVLFERPDVARALKDDRQLLSGWNVSFNRKSLGSGEHTLYAYILIDNQKAMRLNGHFRIVVP